MTLSHASGYQTTGCHTFVQSCMHISVKSSTRCGQSQRFKNVAIFSWNIFWNLTYHEQTQTTKHCCKYLQVMTLTEIADHTSHTLLPQVLSSATNPVPKGLTGISKSTLQWPNVALPSPACWHFWSKTICTVYTSSTTGMQLCQPLGLWHATHDHTRFWHWQMNNPTHLLYCAPPNDEPHIVLPTHNGKPWNSPPWCQQP